MRTAALAKRILAQIKNDKRTLAMMLAAPLLILTLLYFVFGGAVNTVNVGIINAPEQFMEKLYDNNAIPVRYEGNLQGLDKGLLINEIEHCAQEMLTDSQVTAVVHVESGKIYMWIDGSNSVKAGIAIKAIEMAGRGNMPERPDMRSEIAYVYGAEDLELFDNFAAALMGFLLFFLVFLISGISFLKERTTGTLEKMLSTPIKRREIVVGYVLGFGVINILQSVIVSFYLVYVLDVMMVGSIWLVLLTTLLTAITALTLGMLVSTAAISEFQMVQFVPLIIVPQVFFTGLFTLSPGWERFGHLMPLYYTANALKSVMLKNAGFTDILPDLMVLVALSGIFMFVNTKMLKKYRKI